MDAWIKVILDNPRLVAEAAEISMQFLDVLLKRIADGQSKLSALLQKADQAVLREIAAAFEALADAQATTSSGTRSGF